MLEIVTNTHELHRVSIPIHNPSEHRHLVIEMREMLLRTQGLGLAAVQVGSLVRIIIIDNDPYPPFVLYNPLIAKTSEQFATSEESCLSIPDKSVIVRRPETVKISALNNTGDAVVFKFSGLKAVVAQHEMDHLNGVIITDYLGELNGF